MSGAESGVGGVTGRLWGSQSAVIGMAQALEPQRPGGVPVLALNNLLISASFLISLNSVSLANRDKYSNLTWLL